LRQGSRSSIAIFVCSIQTNPPSPNTSYLTIASNCRSPPSYSPNVDIWTGWSGSPLRLNYTWTTWTGKMAFAWACNICPTFTL
jgi:hypothetical protein